jgi:hypothetical protein
MKDPIKAIIVVASSAALFGVLYPMAGGSVDNVLGSQSTVGSCSAFAPGHLVGDLSTVGAQSNICGSMHSDGKSLGHH